MQLATENNCTSLYVLKHRNELIFGILGFSGAGNTMSTSVWFGDLAELLELDEQLKLALNTVVHRSGKLVTRVRSK